MSSNLGWIAPAVARDTRVCVYDRAGRGWSEPADTTQDGAQIATDLHTLLQRGHVPGPYVLAGHSFGGLYVLTFAARYPDEVAGMVLVDSTPPACLALMTGGRDVLDGLRPTRSVDGGHRGTTDRGGLSASAGAGPSSLSRPPPQGPTGGEGPTMKGDK